MMKSLIKKPNAWLPIVLSVSALAAMLIYIEIAGVPTRQTDEGTGAHLFQIWLVLEVLMIGFFAVRWLSQTPKEALWILAIQIVSALLFVSTVFFLKL